MKNKKLFAILTLLCFLFTLMPVAAFAAPVTSDSAVTDMSIFQAVDGDDTVSVNTTVQFVFKVRDNGADETSAPLNNVYIWAEDAQGNRTSALNVATETGVTATGSSSALNVADNTYGPFEVSNDGTVAVSFSRTGDFKLYAGTYTGNANQTIANAVKMICGSTISVYTTNADPEDVYRAELNDTKTSDLLKAAPTTLTTDIYADNANAVGADVAVIGSISATPNNVAEKVVVNFYKESKANNGSGTYADVLRDLSGKTVAISTNSSNITVSKESINTGVSGQIEFTVAAAREGQYKIYLEVDGVQFELLVACGNTSAAYIETVGEPENAIAQYSSIDDVEIEFAVTDINGNTVVGDNALGMQNIYGNNVNGKYITLISKPATAGLKDKELALKYNTETKTYFLTASNKTLDVEGVYEVKVILDNGSYATAKWEIKKFGTPVELQVAYKQEAVELAGTALLDELIYIDANGVQKAAKDAKLAANGYAINAFYPEAEVVTVKGDNPDTTKVESSWTYTIPQGTIYVSSDEKYVGAEIKVTAVSERYNLVATTTVKVTADAAELQFASKTADVNVNNKIDVQLVDAEGNKVAPTNVVDTDIYYVVLDKPEDAKVSVYTASDKDLADKGKFTMALTSNKVGNVAVQAVAKLTIQRDTNTAANTTVVKYYTGTQIIAVGTEGVGDVVVMSVGSNEIIINDAKATIDAAPIVENNRTFVPFRALAEAFGAEVAYDEATQAVTAELNGTTVVMTIGSAAYTVNGVEKTADVAPFINGSRTMVPVRFVAEAFGIKVIPTYDENGATADILFNL